MHRLNTSSKDVALFWVFILFIINFLIRFFLAWGEGFPKHLAILPDELKYYQIAENFAHFRGLLIYNLPTNFQKILYPIILIPAFWFEQREMQQYCMTLINSFIICSAIFPVYFLAKNLLKQNKFIFAILIFFSLSPNLTFSATLMSENLYLPLSMWLFYFYTLFIQKKNISYRFSISLGILTYLAYCCKEIAVFFPISLAIYYIFAYFKINPHSENFYCKIKQSLILFFTVFFVCFLLHFIFFYDLDNFYIQSYSEHKLNFNSLEDYFIFICSSSFYFLIYIILAGGFFSIVLPIIYYSHLTKKAQSTLIFLCLILLQTTLSVVFLIYTNENVNDPYPRTLFRYLCFVWEPFLCCFFSILELQNKPKIKKIAWVSLMILSLIICFSFRGAFSWIAVDNTMLYFLDMYFPQYILFSFKIILVFLSVFCCMLFMKYPSKFTSIFLVFLALFYIINNIGIMHEYLSEKTKETFYPAYFFKNYEKEVKPLEKFIIENPKKQFLVLVDSVSLTSGKAQLLSATFLNYPNVATTDFERIYQYSQPVKFSTIHIPVSRYTTIYSLPYFYSLTKVDYFIADASFFAAYPLNNEIKIYDSMVYFPYARLVENLSGQYFVVYENPTPDLLFPVDTLINKNEEIMIPPQNTPDFYRMKAKKIMEFYRTYLPFL